MASNAASVPQHTTTDSTKLAYRVPSGGPFSSTPPSSTRTSPTQHKRTVSPSSQDDSDATPVPPPSRITPRKTPQAAAAAVRPRERSTEPGEIVDSSSDSLSSLNGGNSTSSDTQSWNTSLTSLNQSLSGSRKVSCLMAAPPNSVSNSPEAPTLPLETVRRRRGSSSAALRMTELQNASPLKAVGANLNRTSLSPTAPRVLSQSASGYLPGGFPELLAPKPKKLNPPLLPSL